MTDRHQLAYSDDEVDRLCQQGYTEEVFLSSNLSKAIAVGVGEQPRVFKKPANKLN